MLTETSYLVANAAGLMLSTHRAAMQPAHGLVSDASPTMAMRQVGQAESSAMWERVRALWGGEAREGWGR